MQKSGKMSRIVSDRAARLILGRGARNGHSLKDSLHQTVTSRLRSLEEVCVSLRHRTAHMSIRCLTGCAELCECRRLSQACRFSF